MTTRLLFTIILLVAATGCDDKPKPYDQRSYDAGFHDGWADTCNQIDRYKESIGKALLTSRQVRRQLC
jgi:hypothetical protein